MRNIQGNLLKAELAKRGMTLTDLAKKLGTSPQSLSRQIKTGRMGIDRAEKIIKILNLSQEESIDIFLPGN